MRKEKKQDANVTLARVQGYHEQTDYSTNYAFEGYTEKKYFTSDRAIKLNDDYTRPDGKPMKGYGLEIETECTGISDGTAYAEVLEKIIFPHFPADLFKMQRDGSLNRVSAECITQPATKEAIRNMYPAYKLMYGTYFPAFGVSCSETGHCGMHVNVSVGCFGRIEEKQADSVKKLLYLINHHYDLMVQLFARDPRHTYYCDRMPEYSTIASCQNANLYNMPMGHDNACNWSHYPEGRIEIRLVGGQGSYGCFRNTMESVFHLVARVQELKWADLDDVVKIFSGCNQYVYDRLATKVYRAGQIARDQLEAIRATVKIEELL